MILIKEFSEDMQENTVRFFTEVFPESGKSFELGGRHSYYADIKRNFTGFWCLLDDDRIIGTVAVKKLSDEVCELKCMYLYREYQGQGLGRRLAETAISYAKEKGFGKMVLDTISTYEKALRLYKKLGFAPTERYNNNEKADIFMSKIL